MLENLQKKILLKYPLIWNTKLVPMLCATGVINLLYFAIGYANGSVNFNDSYSYNSDSITSLYIFSVITGILGLVLWCVFYFKNNGFKSFYPRRGDSLFFEWFQVFVIVLSLCSFYFFYTAGTKLHQRSYESRSEVKHKLKVIDQTSIFFGSYSWSGGYSTYGPVEKQGKDSVDIIYFGRKYPATSLMNRKIERDYNQDMPSKMETEVKTMMFNDNKEGIKKLFAEYFAIVKERKISTNLTAATLFSLNYHAPDFTKYEGISSLDENTYSSGNGYFVNNNDLRRSMQIIEDAYDEPFFEFDAVLVILYIALGISFCIFSFRVTSGKSWLIAFLALGIMNLVFGLMNVAGASGVYGSLMGLSFLLISAYLLMVIYSEKVKGFSGVGICLFLMMLPYFFPLVLTVVDSNADEREMLFACNFILVLTAFYFVTKLIKTWHALPEQ